MNNFRPKLKSKNLYEVSNFSFNFLKKYQLFVRKNFGYLAYQKNLNYLHYLYQDCPETKGFADFRVLSSGLQNKLVAGCIHRISTSLLNTETGDTLKISGLHNLMIDKDHRGQGYMLLADALKNDKIFFVPGVSGELKNFYKRIACFTVQAHWFRAIKSSRLIPTLKRFFRIPVSSAEAFKAFHKHRRKNLQFLLECNEDFNALIQKDFNSIKGYRIRRSFFIWRIFPHISPSQSGYTTRIVAHDNDGFIAISLGIRKNVPVLRVVYSSIYSQKSSDQLMQASCDLAFELGFPLILLTSDCDFIKSSMKTLKFKELENSPSIYFCSKNKNNTPIEHWQLLGDYGFDEFSFNQKG